VLRSTADGEGNVLWTLAPHDIAVVLRLFGALPDRVVARGGAWLAKGAPGIATIRLELGDATADLFVSCVHHSKDQRLTVVGTDATATFDDVHDELVVHSGGARRVLFEEAEPLRLECRAFLSAVATREPPLADGRSALEVLRVVAAAESSLLADGSWVAP
jgi:predicted dehydrogenase